LRSDNVWILRKWINGLVELIKYKNNIYITLLDNSRCPTMCSKISFSRGWL